MHWSKMPQTPCSHGANCFVMDVPNGSYGIAHDGKLFYAAMPQRCPV